MEPRVLLRGNFIDEQGDLVKNGYVLIHNEKIEYAGDRHPLQKEEDVKTWELPAGFVMIPGMIDVHIHGAAGADVMDGSTDALRTIASALPAEGTTSFLATTMTDKAVHIEKALEQTASYIKRQKRGAAEIIGIHLEGPFLSRKRTGAQPIEFIQYPSVERFEKWQGLAESQIRLVTLAPEEDSEKELTAHLAATNVIASIGHSDANYGEVKKGIAAGISHVTHLFNAMKGMHHRDPGVAGAALLEKELMVEVIPDGIHVCPEMMKLAYELTGSSRTILITDSMRAKGLVEGCYKLAGQQVTVKNKRAVLHDGTLAGSILRMNDGIKNMRQFTGCSLADIVKMTSVNAAKELKLFHRKGSLSAGKDADITVLSDEYDVYMTFCRGKLGYHRERAEE
jgi:N-acetylglucosamine-6-phosphate deacetylase